jgi:general secretion pathway protein G
MLEKLKARRGDEGFTLIELLIVIIILAILATIVIFAVGTTTKNAAVAACKATAKSIETALEAYHAQTSNTATGPLWPANLTALATKKSTVTGTIGPWLRTKPPKGGATGDTGKYGFGLGGTGKLDVYTPAKTATAHTFDSSTTTACATA